MDLDVEIAKCEKKLALAQMNLGKIIKTESHPDYKETVPENVRQANTDKVCLRHYHRHAEYSHDPQRKTLEVEISTLEASKDMFAKLK